MKFDFAETATGTALLVLGVSPMGCESVAKAAGGASAEQRAPETRKKAPITPALVAASERVLLEHYDAPVGSEFPIVVEGKAYLARIEEHENSSGSASRPPGKHKGVTVYLR